MNKIPLLKTKNDNYYIYSNSLNYFLPVHSELKNIIEGKVLSVEKYNSEIDYYNKKYAFLISNGFFNDDDISLVTSIDPDSIKMKLASLQQLLIEVTDDCNLNCKYCSYGELYNNYDQRNKTNQIFSRVKVLIDYLKDLWISPYNISQNKIIDIGFYGGEPLVNMKLIKEIVEYIDSFHLSNVSFNYRMTSNGVLLNKYMDYLVEHKFNLLISLDGDEKENSYRVTLNGKNSFNIVYSNIKKMIKKYPDYYKEKVNIHSVLHNRNSYKDTFLFVFNNLYKKPTLSSLNSNGIRLDKKKDFHLMFKDAMGSYKEAMNCKEVVENTFFERVDVVLLKDMFANFSGNTIYAYNDFFSQNKMKKYIPTGTCFPFSKRIFLTVNGKLLPCERIGQELPVGFVSEKKVYLDFSFVSEVYKKMYDLVVYQCYLCQRKRSCGRCMFFSQKEIDIKCPDFLSKSDSFFEFSDNYSFIEDNPRLYKRFSNIDTY